MHQVFLWLKLTENMSIYQKTNQLDGTSQVFLVIVFSVFKCFLAQLLNKPYRLRYLQDTLLIRLKFIPFVWMLRWRWTEIAVDESCTHIYESNSKSDTDFPWPYTKPIAMVIVRQMTHAFHLQLESREIHSIVPSSTVSLCMYRVMAATAAAVVQATAWIE